MSGESWFHALFFGNGIGYPERTVPYGHHIKFDLYLQLDPPSLRGTAPMQEHRIFDACKSKCLEATTGTRRWQPGRFAARWMSHALLASPWLLLFAQSSFRPLAVADNEPGGRVEKSIKTERLELVSPEGKTNAVLSTLKDGTPSMEFRDSQDRTRLTLGLSSRGEPLVYLYGPDPKSLISMSMNDTVGPGVNMRDANGKLRLLVALSKEGTPWMQMTDAEDKPLVNIGSLSQKRGQVTLYSQGMRSTISLGFSNEDEPELHMNEADENRVSLIAYKMNPVVEVRSAKTKAAAMLGLLLDGNPGLLLSDKQSRPAFSIILDDRGEPIVHRRNQQP